MKYCCKVCGKLNKADSWVDGHLKCQNCGQLIKSIDNAVCTGQHIADRYELQKLLELRAYNNIYIAIDLYENTPVILRLYFWDFTYAVTDSDKFLELAQSISYLAQPTHLKITDYGKTHDGLIYTVWPYENLESITRLMNLNGSFTPSIALAICKDIAICLDEFYDKTGVNHLNLNTNKIYLNSKGQTKLSDLGHAAALLQDDHFNGEDSEFFNERFLAPEVILENKSPNLQSDMFSLGACLFTMVNGCRPFDKLDFVSIQDYQKLRLRPSLELKAGEPFTKILYKLMAIDPENRYSSWPQVIKDMESYLKLNTDSNTHTRRCSLTSQFDCDFTNLKSAGPVTPDKKTILLSASDTAKALNSTRPTRKKINKNRSLGFSIAFAASMALAFTVYYLNKDSINKNIRESASDIRNIQPVYSDKTVEKPQNLNLPQNNIIQESPEISLNTLNRKSISLSAKDDFDELKFKVRELTLRQKWLEAHELVNNYQGPYISESLALKTEISRRQKSPIKEIAESTANSPVTFTRVTEEKTTKPIQFNADQIKSVENLIHLFLTRQFTHCLQKLKNIEETQNVNLSFFKDVINNAGIDAINHRIIQGYKYEFGQEKKYKLYNSQYIQGQLSFMDSNKGELTFTTTSKKNKVLHIDKLHCEENIKRLHHYQADKATLLKIIYCLHRDHKQMALELSRSYKGPLKGEIENSLEGLQ